MDQLATNDRLVVADQQHLGLEAAHQLERLQEAERLAVLVAANRHQVGKVAKEGAEEIAGEADAVLRQPDHHRVERLATRCGDQLDLEPPQLERVAVVERNGRSRGRLGRCLGADPFAHVAVRLADGLRPGEEAALGAKAREQPVVVLVRCVARLCDELAALVHEEPGAAHVIDVALGEEHVSDRAPVDGVVDLAMDGSLEAHAGVDDDAPFGGDDQIAVRQSLGEVDEVVDGARFGLAGRLDVETGRARSVEGGGHAGSRSRSPELRARAELNQ